MFSACSPSRDLQASPVRGARGGAAGGRGGLFRASRGQAVLLPSFAHHSHVPPHPCPLPTCVPSPPVSPPPPESPPPVSPPPVSPPLSPPTPDPLPQSLPHSLLPVPSPSLVPHLCPFSPAGWSPYPWQRLLLWKARRHLPPLPWGGIFGTAETLFYFISGVDFYSLSEQHTKGTGVAHGRFCSRGARWGLVAVTCPHGIRWPRQRQPLGSRLQGRRLSWGLWAGTLHNRSILGAGAGVSLDMRWPDGWPSAWGHSDSHL